jgi:thiamine phosphate synthase YjbQ (UPF0047 family)
MTMPFVMGSRTYANLGWTVKQQERVKRDIVRSLERLIKKKRHVVHDLEKRVSLWMAPDSRVQK